MIANYPWPAAGRSAAANGGTESSRPPSLLRLRPEDLGLGPALPGNRQTSTAPGTDDQAEGLAAEERRTGDDESVEDSASFLHHHHHQHQQELGNHDNALINDPLVLRESYTYIYKVP